MANETKLSKEIREAVKKQFPNIRFTRIQCGKIRVGKHWIQLSEAGWCDYIGYLPDGRFFAMEIKDPKGHTNKQRAEIQDSRIDDINRCGGIAIKVSSVEEAIEQIDKRFAQIHNLPL